MRRPGPRGELPTGRDAADVPPVVAGVRHAVRDRRRRVSSGSSARCRPTHGPGRTGLCRQQRTWDGRAGGLEIGVQVLGREQTPTWSCPDGARDGRPDAGGPGADSVRGVEAGVGVPSCVGGRVLGCCHSSPVPTATFTAEGAAAAGVHLERVRGRRTVRAVGLIDGLPPGYLISPILLVQLGPHGEASMRTAIGGTLLTSAACLGAGALIASWYRRAWGRGPSSAEGCGVCGFGFGGGPVDAPRRRPGVENPSGGPTSACRPSWRRSSGHWSDAGVFPVRDATTAKSARTSKPRVKDLHLRGFGTVIEFSGGRQIRWTNSKRQVGDSSPKAVRRSGSLVVGISVAYGLAGGLALGDSAALTTRRDLPDQAADYATSHVRAKNDSLLVRRDLAVR